MADSIATLVLRIVAHNATAAGFAGVRSEMRGLETAAGIGAVAVGAIGVAAIKTAADYQRSLTQVANNTTMGTRGMQAMDAAIRAIAARSPASMDELAQGYMRIANLGFGAADATKILDAAQKSAVSTGSDVGATTNMLANVLHEYSMGGQQAAGAMDVLHLAAAQGNMTLEQLVESGGKAIAMAANLGVPLTQVTAALAALTRHGESASVASTNVAGLLSKIVNPAKAARTELALLSERSGVDLLGDFSAAGLRAKGLSGVLEDIRAARVNATELFKIVPAMRGGIGAQILTGTGAQDLLTIQKSLDATLAGKSTPTADAYARSQKTLDFQLGVLRNNLKLLAIALATPLLPAITAAAQALSGLLQRGLQAVQHPSGQLRTLLGQLGVVARAFAGTLGLVGQSALALAAAILGTLGPLGAHNRATAQGTTHLRQMGAGLALLIPALIAWRGAVTLAHAAQAAWSVAMAAWRVATLAAHAVVLLFRGAIVAWHGVTLLAHGLTVAWTAAQWLLRAALVAGNAVLVVGRGIVLAYAVAMDLLRAAVLAGAVGGARFVAQQILINTWNLAVRGATVLWTAAQWLLNAALTANPIGIVVVAIGLLVAALILAWNHSKTLRDLLTSFWAWLSGVFAGGLKDVGDGIKDFLGGAFQFVADKITWFMDKMRGLLTLAAHLPKVGDFAKAALAALDALTGRAPPGGVHHTVHHTIAHVLATTTTARGREGEAAIAATAAAAGTPTAVATGLTPAQRAAAEAVLHPPPRPRTPEQAAVLDFHTAMTRFAGQKGIDPGDVARMAADLAKIAAADPARAAQLQAQLENATQRRHEAIAHHGAVEAHHRQVLAQRAAHHAQVVAHHNRVVAHHAIVRAAHADAATLLRTIHNEIREQRFAQAARDIAQFRGLETTALRGAGLDPTRARREAEAIARGLQDELARAERGRPARPVALQDAVDRFKADLLTLGTSARDHARLIADVARVKADEIAAHYRGARVALDLAENMRKVGEHFKIMAAARLPIAPVPRYGALAGETGYGGVTVSFGGAQANPWQAVVAHLQEQNAHLRAQLAKDDQLIALLEVGNATDGQQLAALRSIDGHVTPGPPQPAHSVNSHLKARGGFALTGRP